MRQIELTVIFNDDTPDATMTVEIKTDMVARSQETIPQGATDVKLYVGLDKLTYVLDGQLVTLKGKVE